MQTNTAAFKNVTIPVAGMSCGSCVRHIRTALDQQPGVKTAEVNLAAGEVTVCFNPEFANVEALVQAIRKSGYQAALPQTRD
jgi:copper chaperone CopZ